MRRGLAVAALSALALSACSVTANKIAGRGSVDDPATNGGRLACLRAHHLDVTVLSTTELQIGRPPAGPTVRFAPSAGSAEGDQIAGLAQGAEVIGSALVYPNQAGDSEMQNVENCVAQGVSG